MAYLTDLGTNGQKTVKLLATNLGIAATNDLVAAGAAAYAAGATDAQVLDVLFKNSVVQGTQPKLGPNYSDSAFVTQLITNIIGAVSVSTTDKAAWVTQYTAELAVPGAYASRGAFAAYLDGVFHPATAPAAGTAAALVYAGLENRWEASAYYAQTPAGSTFTSMTQVTTPVSTVTDDLGSVTRAIDSLAPTQSFTLTTSADTTLLGGAGTDTYTATIGTDALAANGTTLNAGDVLSGGAGTDTLNLSISGTASGAVDKTTAAFTMTGVENVVVSNYQTLDTSNNVIDMSQSSGVTSIRVTGSASSGDTSFTGLGAIVTAEMGNGAGDLFLAYTSTPVAGTADAQTLNLRGQTAGEFMVNGIETLNVDSGTSANTVAINDGSTRTIATINVTGASNLTLTEGATNADTAVTRINASALTGNLTVTTGSAAQNMSITGGTGNDAITFSGNTFTSSDSVDGGSGTDSLSIASAVTSATTLTNVTNVETLKVTGANSVTLAANISATTIDVDNGTSVSDVNTVTLNSGYTNATTVLLDASDVLLNSSANVALTAKFLAANAVTITGGTGVDTLNITADNGTVTFTSKITAVDAITIVDGGDTASTAGKDVILNVLAYATALSIDGSALDAAVSGATDATSENLTVDATGATANLTVIGGAGADSITGGTKNDNISTGAGNDTITMAGNLTSADTIDGGSGTDTLAVTSVTSTGFTNVTNVEVLALSGAGSTATLSSNLAFTSVSLTQDTNVVQTLTIGSGYTNALTVSVDAGDKVVNSANVALTINTNGAGSVGTIITGGTGTDVMNVTADNGTVTFASQITNVETITVVDGGDATATAGKDLTLTLGAYATALTIDGTAMDAADATATDTTAEILTVSGASVTKALTISVGAGGSTISTGTGAYNDVVTGGAGVDSVTGGAGNDNYNLGAGNDVIDMSGGATYFDNNDTLAGGTGSDTLKVMNGTVDVNYMNVTSIETLTVTAAGTTTLATFANAAGITTINGVSNGANTITATGMTSNLTFNAAVTGSVLDSLTGGSGNDNFKFANNGTAAPDLSTDAVIGGSGTDTLTITMGTATNALTGVTLTNVATIEAITITGTGAGGNVGLTTVNGNFVSVTSAAINASGMTGTGTFSFDGSAEAESTFVITGATAANTLVGGSGADSITGGAAADKITGGIGADTMTGGAGADTFFYTGSGFETGTISPSVVYYGGTVVAGTSVGTSGLDKILDFAVGDTITTNAGGGANITDMTSNATGAIWSAANGYLKGTYDSTAQTFTFSTTGADSLFVYDFDGNTSTNDLRGIVLVGYVDTGTADGGGTGLIGVA